MDAWTTPHVLYRRRLSDRLLLAFHEACDAGDLGVAFELLDALEKVVTRPPKPGQVARTALRESLVAAHQRLWHLRHPAVD
jgi:hypothetical protein